MRRDAFSEALARSEDSAYERPAQLVSAVYEDLRRLASRHMERNRWIATLDTTVLVNESYLRLVSPAAQHAQSRRHFLNIASCAMRQIICDHARKRLLIGNHVDRSADIADADRVCEEELAQARQFVAIDEALDELARREPRWAAVVESRFFAGLSEEETACALGTSMRTVQRDWNAARRWLAVYLEQ